MAKKDKENSAWKDRYEGFEEKDRKNTPRSEGLSLDKKAASNIVSNGVSIRNIPLLARGNWLLVADVWFVFILCCVTQHRNDYATSRNLLMIDVIATCWALFEISKKALAVYGDNARYIPAAVSLFGSRDYAKECRRLGYTRELVDLADERKRTEKTAELERKLRMDVFRKTAFILVLLLTGSFCLWGFIRYWEVKKALLFGLLGIPAALLVSLFIALIQRKAG